MKKLLMITVLMLSSVALFGCMKKSAPANTVPADQEPVISQITLYQVLLQ
jgi:uncharacterized lipoprotein YbaY